MPNQSWIKIQRENGKQDYAQVSRSHHYPEQSAKQIAKRKEANSTGSSGNGGEISESVSGVIEALSNRTDVQPSVHSTSPRHSINQLHTTSDNAEDSSSIGNRMDGR